jgi:hypothetical protein
MSSHKGRRCDEQGALILYSLSPQRMRINRCANETASDVKENDMKGIRHVAGAALLGLGMVSAAQAHVFVGVGVGMPVVPVVPVAPVVPALPVTAVPVYAPPPPVYYLPPTVYAPPVVVSYWGHPHGWWSDRYYGYGYRY